MQLQAITDKYQVILASEKGKAQAVQDKHSEYKASYNRKLKQNDASKREKYELQKAATQSHIELERQKQLNQDLMQAIKLAKQNPTHIV